MSRAIPTADELHSLLADAAAEVGVTGAQIALSQDEQTVDASFGLANRALGIDVTPGTAFQIGSVSKVWTAALVMQLVDAGLIDLDASVDRYLGQITLSYDNRWREITPRMLMSMSSGLDNGPYIDTGPGDDSVERTVRLMAALPLIFAPGSSFGYSNASTRVSGLIVERLTQSTWDRRLQESLLVPGGFTEAVSAFDQLPYYRVASGHDNDGTTRHRWTASRGGGPSGQTLAVSARDLRDFGRVFLGGGVAPNGTRLLSPDAVALMHHPQVDVPTRSYAHSWGLGPNLRVLQGGVHLWGHPGNAQNGASQLYWVPEHDAALAITTNTPLLASRLFKLLGPRVLETALGLDLAEPPEPQAASPDPQRLSGVYQAWGRDYRVWGDNGTVMLELADNAVAVGPPFTAQSALRPIGTDRFTADNDAVTFSFGWELAFSGHDDAGRATLLHNGAFTARRIA